MKESIRTRGVSANGATAATPASKIAVTAIADQVCRDVGGSVANLVRIQTISTYGGRAGHNNGEAFSHGGGHDGSPDGRSEPAVLPFQPRRTDSSGSSPTPAQSNRRVGTGRSSREAGAVLQRHRAALDRS